MQNHEERIRTSSEISKEQSLNNKKTEEEIKKILNILNDNRKFEKLILHYLSSIINLITDPPNQDIPFNIKTLINSDGIKTLSSICLENLEKDVLITQCVEIICKFTKSDKINLKEISELIIKNLGHTDIIQLTITLNNRDVVFSLLNLLNILAKFPFVLIKLINSGIIESLKFIGEKNEDDKDISSNLIELLLKISSQTKGREEIINNKILSFIYSNMQKYLKIYDYKNIYNCLIIINNIAFVNEGGRTAIQEIKNYSILSEINWHYFYDNKIINVMQKILSRIFNKENYENQLQSIKRINEFFVINKENKEIEEFTETLIYLSTFRSVDKAIKILCSNEKIKTITDFFVKLVSIDKANNGNNLLLDYIVIIKHFLLLFKTIIKFYYKSNKNADDNCLNFVKSVLNSYKKIHDVVMPIIENDKDIKKEFLNYFSAYCEINPEIYKCYFENENLKKNINLLPYIENILEDIQINKNLFINDLKINYNISLILNSMENIIINCDNSTNIIKLLINLINYLKEILENCDHIETITNILQFLYTVFIKNKNINGQINDDIISIVVNYMKNKNKFRYPNFINLNILDYYLSQEKLNSINSTKDFIYAINSVLIWNAFEESKEEIETEILNKSIELIRKIILKEEFSFEINLLNEINNKYISLNSMTSKEEILTLKKELSYFYSVLDLKEYFDLSVQHILTFLYGLISKEINYIENYKETEKKNQNKNQNKFDEICTESTNILYIEMLVLEKIQKNCIINFNITKNNNYISLFKIVSDNNVQLLQKITDIKIIIKIIKISYNHANFLIANNELFKYENGVTLLENYLNILSKLIWKFISNEKIAYICMKFINIYLNEMSNNNNLFNETCNILVKLDYQKIIIQILNNIVLNENNNELLYESLILLQKITLSNEENVSFLANQNILKNLLQIRIKCIKEKKICLCIDTIANEISNLPGQADFIEETFSDATFDLQFILQENLGDEKFYENILEELEIINAYSCNKNQIDSLINSKNFIDDFQKAVEKTLKTKEMYEIFEKLLINEASLISKLKNNLVNSKQDDKISFNVFAINLLRIIKKSIFPDSFLLSCNVLIEYTKNTEFFKQYFMNEIDKEFIEHLFNVYENNLNNPDIKKITHTIFSYLSSKNTECAKIIANRGGLVNLIEGLKFLIHLNDDTTKYIKYNSMAVLDTLLNDEKNLDIFLKTDGIDLINNIINNEVEIKTKNKNNKEREDQYKTLCIINTKVNEKKKEIEESNNYLLYCLKIINKGLDKNKYEFIKGKVVENIINLTEINFPEKDCFTELVDIIVKLKEYYGKNYDINNEDIKNFIFESNKNMLKLSLSIKAFYFGNKSLNKKIKYIEENMPEDSLNNEIFLENYKKTLGNKYENNEIKNQILTYLSLILEFKGFNNIYKYCRSEIKDFFNNSLKEFFSNNGNDLIKNEGIFLSLIKIFYYLLSQQEITLDEKYILIFENFQKFAEKIYEPKNYIFIYEYENEFKKIIELLLCSKIEKINLDNNYDDKNLNSKIFFIFLEHLRMQLNKFITFVEDHRFNINIYGENDYQKIDLFDNYLNFMCFYFEAKIDNDKKLLICQNLYNNLIIALKEYLKNENYPKNENDPKIVNRLEKLWTLILYSLQYIITNNQMCENINTKNVLILTEILKITIENKNLNKYWLREIPFYQLQQSENTEIKKLFLKFICFDLDKYGKFDEEIKLKDFEILSHLSSHYDLMKIIIQDSSWKYLQSEYGKPSVENLKKRKFLANIFRNSTKNSYNLNYLITKDTNCIKMIFNKVINDPITSLDNDGKIIADIEIDTICNILKNSNNLQFIEENNIINNSDFKKLETLYDNLDINICKYCKPLIREFSLDDKEKNSLKTVNEDEKEIEKLTKIIIERYEEHIRDYIFFNNRDNSRNVSLIDINPKNNNTNNLKVLSGKEIDAIYKSKRKFNSAISVKYSEEISGNLSQILFILRKNYNLLQDYQNDIDNAKRILIVNNCLNLLQKIVLSSDNHELILEGGFINLLEKMCKDYKNVKKTVEDKGLENSYLLDFVTKGKHILYECSKNVNSVSIILDSTIFFGLVNEINNFNENKEMVKSNYNLKKITIYNFFTFINLCILSKPYEEIINKVNVDILINIAKNVENITLIECIIDILIYYFKSNSKNEDFKLKEFFKNVIYIIEKYIKLVNKTPSLISKILNLVSLLYLPDFSNEINNLKLINSIYSDINNNRFMLDEEYLLSALNCLCILTKNNNKNINDCFEVDLIKKFYELTNYIIKDNYEKYEELIYQSTSFYYSLIGDKSLNNENFSKYCKKFCEIGITKEIVEYINIFNELMQTKEKKEGEEDDDEFEKNKEVKKAKNILENCINFMESITLDIESIFYISEKTEFLDYIFLVLKNPNNDNDLKSKSILSLANYFIKEIGSNYKDLNIKDIFILLKKLQTKHYSHTGILLSINSVSRCLIINSQNKNYDKLFFDMISESMKFQDWNSELVKSALNIVINILEEKSFIMDLNHKYIIPNTINILKSFKEKEIRLTCYKIIYLFIEGKNESAISLTLEDLLDQIKYDISHSIFNNTNNKNNNNETDLQKKLKDIIFDLIINLSRFENYSKNISELLSYLINELTGIDIQKNSIDEDTISLFDSLLNYNYLIESFMQNKGLDLIIKYTNSIDKNFTNSNTILQIFSILKKIITYNSEYKLKMQSMKIPDIIIYIIKIASQNNKKIELEGRNILFLISSAKTKLEVVEEINPDIKIENPIKPEIKNYLTSGKPCKLVKDNGDIRDVHLMFTSDLMKIQGKPTRNKSNLIKAKYQIEITNIKKIVKGYGTDAFKKSKGLFRHKPKQEVCFSIIGPRTMEGTKAINIICESENDVIKWINYMEIVINYFTKIKILSGNIEIKK